MSPRVSGDEPGGSRPLMRVSLAFAGWSVRPSRPLEEEAEVVERDARRVVIFGAGTMGSTIALALARFGNSVTLVDPNRSALVRAEKVLRSALELFVDQGMEAPDRVPGILGRINAVDHGEEPCSVADVVIECIVEEREAKRELYALLDRWCPGGAIIASNTSFLNIFELLPDGRQATSVIAHWFAPAHIVPLVEVVRGPATADAVVEHLLLMLRDADRVPVVLNKFVDGFCINRIQRILGREIFFLLDNDYISPEMLDVAVKASIIPRSMVLGLVQRYDFTGLDLSYGNLQDSNYREAPATNQPRVLTELVERGDLGVKSGRGFFDYDGEELVDVLRRRDERLLRVFAELRDLIQQRV